MNHRVGRSVFALLTGLAVAVFAYQWVTNPAPRAERLQQEAAVQAARTLLRDVVVSEGLEIVDPLAPDRKVGKVYVYPEPPGWAVSGFYRRDAQDRWHPYLITMDEALQLQRLKVQDAALADRTSANAALEVRPEN
ncbi:MAG: hypothetical protein HKN64_00580 [Woeseiaceae bacterium]|nr:hypothetical protein [Woeseiaceae bacterium]